MKKKKYWVISPNVKNNNEVDEWRKFLSKYPLVCMGWKPDDKGGAYFYNEMEIGDVVIIAQRQSWNWIIYSLGMVNSNVFYNGNGIEPNVWKEMPTESWYRNLSYWISKPKIASFNGYTGQIPPAIWKLTDEETIKNINAMISNEKMKIKLNEIIKLLMFNKNIILTGAPGTGKTYLAKQIAKQMIGVKTDEDLDKSGQFNFVQFHPSYDYTDFVEGLRPIKEGDTLGFKRQNGIFKEFCKNALDAFKKDESKADDEKRKFVFVIDEINRGEISKIFGELFFSIDPGYRGVKGKVATQYTNLIEKDDVFKNGFYVPENVYIIGTMNDIDRSVESFDFAMRRRFAWSEMSAIGSQSMFNSEDVWKNSKGEKIIVKIEDINNIKTRMDNLNKAIVDNFDYSKSKFNDKNIKINLTEAYQIGASYFLKLGLYANENNLITDESYNSLWRNHIKGVLFEYLRGTQNIEIKLDALKLAFDNKSISINENN